MMEMQHWTRGLLVDAIAAVVREQTECAMAHADVR
jgi:hypothetical protein